MRSFLYTASKEWRNLFRSTAFHNVVQIDGEELNRLISPDHLWHLRDDARPQAVAWHWVRAPIFRGSHNGYARLEPPVLVTCEVLLVKEGPDVLVRDSIEGRGSRELVWRFHLDPALDAVLDGPDVRLRAAGREAWLQLVSAADGLTMTIEQGWISRVTVSARPSRGDTARPRRAAAGRIISIRSASHVPRSDCAPRLPRCPPARGRRCCGIAIDHAEVG